MWAMHPNCLPSPLLILEHKGYMFNVSLTAGLFRFFGRHIASSKLGITMTPRSPLRGGGGGRRSLMVRISKPIYMYWEESHVPTGILLLYLFSTSSLLNFPPICCRLSSFQLFLLLFQGQRTCQNFTQAGPLSRITYPSIVCQAL